MFLLAESIADTTSDSRLTRSNRTGELGVTAELTGDVVGHLMGHNVPHSVHQLRPAHIGIGELTILQLAPKLGAVGRQTHKRSDHAKVEWSGAKAPGLANSWSGVDRQVVEDDLEVVFIERPRPSVARQRQRHRSRTARLATETKDLHTQTPQPGLTSGPDGGWPSGGDRRSRP